MSVLPQTADTHPIVVDAMQKLDRDIPISEIVRLSGYSHRHFNHVFNLGVGVSAKHYQRLTRIDFVLSAINEDPSCNWSLLAADAGYSDQSHLNREFQALCGMTPTDYVRGSRRSSLHVTV